VIDLGWLRSRLALLYIKSLMHGFGQEFKVPSDMYLFGASRMLVVCPFMSQGPVYPLRSFGAMLDHAIQTVCPYIQRLHLISSGTRQEVFSGR
jgi:hypothetical protein